MLTLKEMEIMQVLWNVDRPVTAAEIVELSPHKTWKASSIHNIINSLLKKKIIKEADSVQTVKSYARTFIPVVEKETYLLQYLHEQKLFSENSLPQILTAMIEYSSDKKIILKLKEILNRKLEEQ